MIHDTLIHCTLSSNFRSAFSSALLDLISTEHSQLFGARGRPNGTILGNQRQEVAEWKFATLDKDRDGNLERKEVRTCQTV